MSDILFRKGDVVSVQATVRMDFHGGDDDYIYLDVPGHYNGISLKPEKVKLLKPALEHGDDVLIPCGERPYPDDKIPAKVMAVADDMVWVQTENGDFETFNYKEVTRVSAKSWTSEAAA